MKRLSTILLLTLLCAACQEAQIEEQTNASGSVERIYATINGIEDDTRVELNEKLHTVWSADDQIYVFGPNTYKLYEFDGETGDTRGSFSLETTYRIPAAYNPTDYYAFYPKELFAGYNSIDGSFFLSSEIPQIQEYQRGSYDNDTNTMIGYSQNTRNFMFQNILGYLRVSIKGDQCVRDIELQSNGRETLSGMFSFAADDINSLNWYDNKKETIKIDCGKQGVQLSDTPTDFYFVMMPGEYADGISLTLNFTDDTSFTKSTSKSITIKRNTIQPMSAFKVGDVTWQVVTIKHTNSMIAAPQLLGSTSMMGYIYWGDESYSEINADSSHVYYDDEEEYTITIQAVNATAVELPSCEGITSIDLSDF